MSETVQAAENGGETSPVGGSRKGILGKLLSMGRRSAKESGAESEDMVVTEVEYVPLFGSGLTKDEVIELNGELEELLTALGVDSSRYFNRPLDEYAAPVDLYEELSQRLDEDGLDVDLSQTLATRLGDDHPLVVELRRREALGDVKVLDDFIKSGLGPENAEKVYKKTPNDFSTPLEYYKFLQGRAKENGFDLVPLIKRKLGAEHPLPVALGGDAPETPSFGWDSMRKPRSFEHRSSKKSNDAGTPEETPKEEAESKTPVPLPVMTDNIPSVPEEKKEDLDVKEPDSEKEKMVKAEDPGSENKPAAANVQESVPPKVGSAKSPDSLPVHDEREPVAGPFGCTFRNCFGMR